MICLSCGKENILTKGYCRNTCYQRFLKTGNPKKQYDIKIGSLPALLNQFQEEVLTGLMLGDGCLFYNKLSKSKYPMLTISRKISDIEYLRDNFLCFKQFCNYDDVKLFNYHDKRTNKIYYGCKFSTFACPLFTNYYNLWYINGKKQIPKDLKLTPLTCAIWFCDDGSVVVSKNKRLKIKLSTHGFSLDENVYLINLLFKMFNEKFTLSCDNGKYFITAADSGCKSFIKYIEKYIPISMKRKIVWNTGHFSLNRSRPHLKSRLDSDLNDKEILILKSLNKNDNISSKDICKNINWGNGIKIPSAYFRYLKKFLFKQWITPNKIVINGKNNIKYSISNLGREVLSEALSFNKQND